MFNPYLNRPEQMLEPIRKRQAPLDGIVKKLKTLDRDDLLVLAILYLAMGEGKQEELWPLLAVLLYCIL